MKRNLKVYVALICTWMVAGVPLGSLAESVPVPPSGLKVTDPTESPVSPPPVPPPAPSTPPGNDGLLSGMTPATLRVPSEWTLVLKQDFEGTRPDNETWGSWNGSVNTARPHSGSKSIEGLYQNDQADANWELKEGNIGSFSEVYLSFFEYIESQALFNDEFFLARFARTNPFQEVLADWYWARNASGPAYNGPIASLYVVPQGNRTARYAAKTVTVPKGAWVQWEFHYRPNTPGNSDGFFRIYKDGTLYTSAEKVNLNGTLSMANCSVRAGGTYTKLVWMTDSPACTSCSPRPGDGTDYCTASKRWSGQAFSSPVCSPTDPPLPSFKRYFDDIILMKK